MNFKEKLSSYNLGLLSSSDLPDMAIAGIEEGLESENLFVLAGMDSGSNKFELVEYFDKMISELKINYTKKESFNTLLNYYLSGMINENIDFYEGMERIYRDLVDLGDEIFGYSEEFERGKSGIRKLWGLYIWYNDIDYDVEKGLFYKKNADTDKLRLEYKDLIISEIQTCLEKLNNGTLN